MALLTVGTGNLLPSMSQSVYLVLQGFKVGVIGGGAGGFCCYYVTFYDVTRYQVAPSAALCQAEDSS